MTDRYYKSTNQFEFIRIIKQWTNKEGHQFVDYEIIDRDRRRISEIKCMKVHKLLLHYRRIDADYL